MINQNAGPQIVSTRLVTIGGICVYQEVKVMDNEISGWVPLEDYQRQYCPENYLRVYDREHAPKVVNG